MFIAQGLDLIIVSSFRSAIYMSLLKEFDRQKDQRSINISLLTERTSLIAELKTKTPQAMNPRRSAQDNILPYL